jgi:hypothetical protein
LGFWRRQKPKNIFQSPFSKKGLQKNGLLWSPYRNNFFYFFFFRRAKKKSLDACLRFATNVLSLREVYVYSALTRSVLVSLRSTIVALRA